jgi:hypothetical protein
MAAALPADFGLQLLLFCLRRSLVSFFRFSFSESDGLAGWLVGRGGGCSADLTRTSRLGPSVRMCAVSVYARTAPPLLAQQRQLHPSTRGGGVDVRAALGHWASGVSTVGASAALSFCVSCGLVP